MLSRTKLVFFGSLYISIFSTFTFSAAYSDTFPGTPIKVMRDVHHLLSETTPHIKYNSIPPTSGPHVGWSIPTGIYNQEISNELQVHCLEHGHIIIQYKSDVSSDLKKYLERFAKLHPRDVILAPSSRVRPAFVVTSWGRLQEFDKEDTAGVELFIKVFANSYDHEWINKKFENIEGWTKN
jgi:Protein of unknown function (DUF3105)